MAKALAWAARVPEAMGYAYPGERQGKDIFFGDPTFSTSDYLAIDLRSKCAFEAIGQRRPW